MHASESIIKQIKSWEGGQSPDGLFRPYWDENGKVWTQGYGETQGVKKGDKPWTEAEADRRLRKRIAEDFAPFIIALGIPFNGNQFDALLSAIWNLGPGVLNKGRSLGDALRSSRSDRAAWVKRVQDALRLYVHAANGAVLKGLERRREAEAKLFGDWGQKQPTPKPPKKHKFEEKYPLGTASSRRVKNIVIVRDFLAKKIEAEAKRLGVKITAVHADVVVDDAKHLYLHAVAVEK